MAKAESLKAADTIEDLARASAAADQAREHAHAALLRLEADVRRYRRALDATKQGDGNGPALPVEAYLEALARLPGAEVALAEGRLAARRADSGADTARAAVREALRAEFESEVQALVRKAAADLRRAQASMAALHRRQEAFRDASGEAGFDALAMTGLLPHADTASEFWLRRITEMGFDVDG
jgi:hypothetical protein